MSRSHTLSNPYSPYLINRTSRNALQCARDYAENGVLYTWRCIRYTLPPHGYGHVRNTPLHSVQGSIPQMRRATAVGFHPTDGIYSARPTFVIALIQGYYTRSLDGTYSGGHDITGLHKSVDSYIEKFATRTDRVTLVYDKYTPLIT